MSDERRPPVQWHESVEGSPEDAPLDESQSAVTDGYLASYREAQGALDIEDGQADGYPAAA